MTRLSPRSRRTLAMSGFRPSAARRLGLTLVELLVVIAIIVLLVALAAPALSRAVARSRLTSCTNNQYQIAFALLRFDESFGSVPGWLNDGPHGSSSPCSWPVPLLPLLGRSDVYDAWPQLSNVPTIDVFLCPSNRPPKTLGYPGIQYAGNAGADGTARNDGIFVNRHQDAVKGVALDSVADADGTTTTLAFAEKAALGFSPHTWAYTPADGPAGTLFGSGPSVPPVFGAATPPGPVHPVINRTELRGFAPAGTHPGGVVVAFCDGHTTFLSDSLQPYEYAQLLTPKSRWQGGTNMTNSPAMKPWLLRNGQPYLLDEKILRP